MLSDKSDKKDRNNMCKPLNELKNAITQDDTKHRVALCLHENPDPDSIGAALGMDKLLRAWNPDIKCTKIYSGEISHAQNKTLVNVLNISLTHVNEIEDIHAKFDHFITLDVLPERVLNGYFKDNKDAVCLMSVDHHRVETEMAQIVDIRQVGSTSTIIWDYLREEDVAFEENNDTDATVATALLLGIKTDTSDLVSENVTDVDFEAYKSLMTFVDRRQLPLIINYPIPPYQFELESNLHTAGNVKVSNGCFVGGVGYISLAKRDALPTMAELRARMEGIDTAFVFAIVDDFIEVSVRSCGVSVDVNALCHKIFGKQYSGGKSGAGAAKVPLGFLGVSSNASDDVREKAWEAVKAVMMAKIFHVINANA
jgi:nanoRNase/pAp phosphatase (c-di-AMP/oligoRNAs hydrolase)